MAKYSKKAKLDPEKRKQLILIFCQIVKSIHSEIEAAEFLSDLLTPQELEMLSKRILIAQRLLENKTYQQIRNELKVGFGTIGRIGTWLALSDNRIKKVLKYASSQQNKKLNENYWESQNFKRRFSIYYWPELLIENILKQSDQKHKEKINTILQSMVNNKNVEKYYPVIASRYKKG